MLQSRLSPLPGPFVSFAGFTWPRYLATLPRGTLAERLKDRNVVCGDYYRACLPITGGAHPGGWFYLESDFMPGLRWQWADEVISLRHTGWYTGGPLDGLIRGIVMHLPHGRGFLAGWSMGEGMASSYDGDIYGDEESAAYAADSMAKSEAEKQRDYEAEDRALMEAEEAEIEAERAAFPVSVMGV